MSANLTSYRDMEDKTELLSSSQAICEPESSVKSVNVNVLL